MNTTIQLSERLLALLYSSKQNTESDINPFQLVTDALGKLYSNIMNRNVCIEHCVLACLEINNNPNFTTDTNQKNVDLLKSIMQAPVNLYENPTKLYPDFSDSITFEKLYTDYLNVLISYIRLTRIGWSDQYKEYCIQMKN